MTKFSEQDFDKIVTEFGKTTIGAALVKDYVAVTGTVIDAKGVVYEDHPTDDNAFVISTRQHEGPGKLAHTRIDIRGPDGLIQTSYECDHIAFELTDDSLVGLELLLDVERMKPSTKRGAGPNEFESVVLFPKGTVLTQDNIDEARDYKIAKLPTKLRTPDEVATALKPFLELDHEFHSELKPDGTRDRIKLTATEIADAGVIKKAIIEAAAISVAEPSKP